LHGYKKYDILKQKVIGEQMSVVIVRCPDCDSPKVGKYGFGKKGQQRYKCKNEKCTTKIFQLKYHNKGCERGIERKIIRMAVNASGIRDTARVLEISPYKVISTLKKQNLS
jgi:transposase-like protein